MTEPKLSAGAVLSTAPLVTISKREPHAPMGIASLRPDRFAGQPGVHFVGLCWSAESQTQIDQIAADHAHFTRALANNRFVMLCNSEHESFLMSRAGVPNLLANELIFVDERLFTPQPDADHAARRFDAIYIAQIAPYKRHALAAKVETAAFVYGPPAQERFETARSAVPHALFANHDLHGGTYRYLSEDKIRALINRSHTGLCLSAAEGSMRACMEYLLCGVPVVSTASIGGRDRYLLGPHAKIVEADPEAVAQAVRAFKAQPIDKRLVREYVGTLVGFDRHNFLINANKVVERELGVKDMFKSFEPFLRYPVKWRPIEDVLLPLRAA